MSVPKLTSQMSSRRGVDYAGSLDMTLASASRPNSLSVMWRNVGHLRTICQALLDDPGPAPQRGNRRTTRRGPPCRGPQTNGAGASCVASLLFFLFLFLVVHVRRGDA